jgi:hypothetical protein
MICAPKHSSRLAHAAQHSTTTAQHTHLEADVQVALDKRPRVHGHALIGHHHEAVGLDDLPLCCLDVQRAAVQVLDVEGAATQRLLEADGLLHQQVRGVGLLDALEGVVLLLLHHQDHVAGREARLRAARLAAQHDALPVLHALLHLHLKRLLLAD